MHLKGHFAPARHAVAHWRAQAKAGDAVDARIINTSSGAGLLGSVGQRQLLGGQGRHRRLTLVQAAELARYGVTVNAIAPAARTRMTEGVFADMMKPPAGRLRRDGSGERLAARRVARLRRVARSHRAGVRAARWASSAWPRLASGAWVDKGERWAAENLGSVVRDLIARTPAGQKVYGS